MAKKTIVDDEEYKVIAERFLYCKEKEAFFRDERLKCEVYLCDYAEVNKTEPGSTTFYNDEYKFAISVKPNFKVDEDILRQMDIEPYKDIVQTKHTVSTKFLALPAEQQDYLAQAITYSPSKPSVQIVRIEEK